MAVSSVAAPEKLSQKRNLKTYTAREMSEEEVKACISRPRVDFSSILQAVRLSPQHQAGLLLHSNLQLLPQEDLLLA